MAYFAAVISLKNTIQRLLNSFQLSILTPSEEILEFALKAVGSVQEVLENNEELIIKNCDNERVTSLTGQIREAAYKLEDALESHASDQYESLANEVFLDFDEVKEEINYFVETMEKIEKMMIEELNKPLPEEEEDVVPLKIDGGKNSKMVGLSKQFDELKDQINDWASTPGSYLLAIDGMAGIGKTALATNIFEDPSVSSHFNPRVFVTIGPKYQSKKVNVMLSILDQMNQDVDKIRMEEDVDLAEYILSSLQGKKYLIVFDDVWNRVDFLDLFSLLPQEESNPSVVLVTSRLKEVDDWYWSVSFKDIIHHSSFTHTMHFLNEEDSWGLLREKVFGAGYICPFQLEEVGKKIAKHCEGLPLTIITVANILSKREKTLEYWNEVADENTSVFMDAYDQMWDVLILSYNHLPQYLKSCFLYMGAFPLRLEIRVSKLIKIWHSEGFIEGIEDDPQIYFLKLSSTNIILVHEESSRHGIKMCKLHSAFWHLCVKQACKEKFLYVINNYASSFTEDIENQRRLCIYNNVLFGIKEVRSSMESISMARSLLCTGQHLRYPVLCFGLRLLRLLFAHSVRFYNFPTEVLKLVWLRLLAFTYSGNIPGSISKLRNLEHLIVNRHLIINKFCRDSSYLPLEIWNMKELRHIRLDGGNLPHPCGALLPNLLTLSGLSVNSCSKEILERTPNLKKLGIQITLSPDVVEPLCRFDYFSLLHHLESLKCFILNPKPKSQVVAPIRSFPSHLKKLNLIGLGYPWKYMRIIAKLPKLDVLKLQCYAFQGPVWETYKGEFSQLKSLLLEDMDLVHWRANSIDCFPFLECLVIKSCYKLQEIPSPLGCNSERGFMELVDCFSFRASVQQLREDHKFRDIYVWSSLDDQKLK